MSVKIWGTMLKPHMIHGSNYSKKAEWKGPEFKEEMKFILEKAMAYNPAAVMEIMAEIMASKGLPENGKEMGENDTVEEHAACTPSQSAIKGIVELQGLYRTVLDNTAAMMTRKGRAIQAATGN